MFSHLVTAYSLSPPCKGIALNVPMHPLRRLSLPIFQVTKRGLKDKGALFLIFFLDSIKFN